MALRLRIISDQRHTLGTDAEAVFGVGGGTIGRSADNDWVLPDPQRYVSALHARIHCRHGDFYLEDVSTNGVYVNGADFPLGRHGTYKLQPGDMLRFGEYHVAVELEPPAEDSVMIPDSEKLPAQVQLLRAEAPVADVDLGASLNLEELFVPEFGDSPGEEEFIVSVGAYGQPVSLEPRAQPARAEDPAGDRLAARKANFARVVAERERRSEARLPDLGDVQSGLEAFCRGAGIASERLPPEAQARALYLAGLLFREALLGLKDLERTRKEICSRLGVEIAVDEEATTPSLAKSTIGELLVELFGRHESRRLDAVQWLRDSMDATKAHEHAMVQAMHAAFADFIGRLEPADLTARFERAASRNGRAPGDRALYWDLYADFYRNLTEMPADNLPHIFLEAFANAYRELLNQPV